MAQGKLALKSRIRSVDSTRKITKAMQLVATSKLKKQRDVRDANHEYAHYLKESVSQIIGSLDSLEHPYLQRNKEGKTLQIVFTSNMGLCGGYNANVYRLLKEQCSKDDDFIIFGTRGVNALKSQYPNIIKEVIYMEEQDAYAVLSKVCIEALQQYVAKTYKEINVVYTNFVNSVTFEPVKTTLLPLEVQGEKSNVETLFEPAGSVILNQLVPMYLKSMTYSYYLDTRTSEEANRRMAMESATDNADELKEALELQFNQARQAAITQEISEIVAGADAL